MQPAHKQALGINGTRTSGLDTRRENVTAVAAVANIVKSSLGPIGLDKMLVDDLGEVTITNDGATILANLEVEHPAARVLVQRASDARASGRATTRREVEFCWPHFCGVFLDLEINT